MDKRVIFSVAGSGKTSFIISKLSLAQSSLILTYTINASENIRHRIVQQWGFMPPNIKVSTYFGFLYSFCFKPLLGHRHRARGLIFEPNPPRYLIDDARYITSKGRLYHNRIAKFFEDKMILSAINDRIAKYYHNLFIDEVQDFAGHDFNLLKSLAKAPVNILMVGDFYQHTFDTSRDGNVNKTLHDDLSKYQKQFEKMRLTVDHTTLNKSWRCSQEVCDFIKEFLGIMIDSHRTDRTQIREIKTTVDAKQIAEDMKVIKLFYQKHYVNNCYSRNWGDCKGEDKYKDVCVILSDKMFKDFGKKKLNQLSAQTLNKLYVACSRPKGDLILMSQGLFNHAKKEL